MRFLSVCSGIEAASVAWAPLGWSAVAFSEIEPFPCAVLAHHYPGVPNWGDMTKYKEWPDADVDLLCGGTPCQSFSVAGLRKGLDDPRGNLMLTFGAIAGRYRPRWLVWENVPGVLSSNGGRDFASFLGLITGQQVEAPASGWQNSGIIPGIDNAYGVAYRTLDAQYFGVAQRRRRVFVVGYLGDWRRAAAVLFERHSLSGDPAPSREAGNDVAPTLDVRAGRSGETTFHTSGGLIPSVAMCHSRGGGQQRMDAESETLIPTIGAAFDVANTLLGKPSSSHAADLDTYVAHSLRGEGFDASEDGTANALLTPNGGRAGIGVGAIHYAMTVRRLTPEECEALQAFPRSYTRIPWRGRVPDQCPDGPRYKALGNSWCTAVARWIGERIEQVESLEVA